MESCDAFARGWKYMLTLGDVLCGSLIIECALAVANNTARPKATTVKALMVRCRRRGLCR